MGQMSPGGRVPTFMLCGKRACREEAWSRRLDGLAGSVGPVVEEETPMDPKDKAELDKRIPNLKWCQVDDCDGMMLAHGLCSRHYQQWRRGNPYLAKLVVWFAEEKSGQHVVYPDKPEQPRFDKHGNQLPTKAEQAMLDAHEEALAENAMRDREAEEAAREDRQRQIAAEADRKAMEALRKQMIEARLEERELELRETLGYGLFDSRPPEAQAELDRYRQELERELLDPPVATLPRSL